MLPHIEIDSTRSAVLAQGEVELLGDRRAPFTDELLQRHGHRNPRAQAAGDHLQRVGQLLFDEVEPAPAQQSEGKTR